MESALTKVENNEPTVHILELIHRSGASADALYNRRLKPTRRETTPERVRRKQPQTNTQIERIDTVAQSVSPSRAQSMSPRKLLILC